MKITGYRLREALRKWQLRRDAATSQFEGSLAKFKDESKAPPGDIARRIAEAEAAICHLQLAQAQYNARVVITAVGGGPMVLLAAIKAVGPLTRAEKMWRSAAGVDETTKKRRTIYSGILATRSKDNEAAEPTITPDEAAKHAEAAGRELSRLREAIAAGNTHEVEIENLNAALLE